MRRAVTIVVLWLAAGLGAIALTTAAVSMVGNKVTGSRPASLSADQVRDELTSASRSTTTVVPGQGSGPGATTLEPMPATQTGSGAGTTSTTRPPVHSQPGTKSGDDGSPSTTAAPAPAATVRTYSLVGGTATLQFSPSGVTVQDATPKPGFSVSVENEDANGVRVVFRSDTHESRVDGWWDGGPQDRVREGTTSDG